MKRTMILVVMVLTLVMAFNTNAHAGVRDDAIRARFEKQILTDWTEGYERFKEQKADGEIHLVKDVAMTYNEVGVNVYNICVHFVLEEKEQRFEMHAFYDAVEDEWFSEYIQFGEERMSLDDFEELYPELNEEVCRF